jgi:hypothetical protein
LKASVAHDLRKALATRFASLHPMSPRARIRSNPACRETLGSSKKSTLHSTKSVVMLIPQMREKHLWFISVDAFGPEFDPRFFAPLRMTKAIREQQSFATN